MMANQRLREAIVAAGLTHAEIAKRLRVDVKTVDRWISPGRLPRREYRRKLAELLDRGEEALWDLSSISGSGRLSALESELAEARRRLEDAERERLRYAAALWRVVEHGAIPLHVSSHTIQYDIGDVPERDCTLERWLVESVDGQTFLWWLIAIGPSGELVPYKATIQQLERLEAYQVLDGGERRRLHPLYLGQRSGKMWAMLLFDRELPRVSIEVTWSWVGVWNMLRSTHRDETSLDLDHLENVDWGSIAVIFRFPPGMRDPEVRTSPPVPALQPTVVEDDDGRVTYTFHLDRPGHRAYSWELQIQSLDP